MIFSIIKNLLLSIVFIFTLVKILSFNIVKRNGDMIIFFTLLVSVVILIKKIINKLSNRKLEKNKESKFIIELRKKISEKKSEKLNESQFNVEERKSEQKPKESKLIVEKKLEERKLEQKPKESKLLVKIKKSLEERKLEQKPFDELKNKFEERNWNKTKESILLFEDEKKLKERILEKPKESPLLIEINKLKERNSKKIVKLEEMKYLNSNLISSS
ncbi:hypothetical protein DDB_G0280501 [Dictyostelium discoideum AX4]|uniref:Uncharacterized protein n=1 Tax=Dictyostelium discoideum TaxID=44689 RepID=Q54V98_DICDI|nr:hypothetical protein DDB_G0280501 [Dictyostelium discoideum AX4]EAL67230.1 hypothetical protein DDB_G0280501 [Dictyostelium discoideum AX4]|eukprot:XP_641210.1 hypothetical protein DDB_G0280501 [Dictyostelium discoideum AX4]